MALHVQEKENQRNYTEQQHDQIEHTQIGHIHTLINASLPPPTHMHKRLNTHKLDTYTH